MSVQRLVSILEAMKHLVKGKPFTPDKDRFVSDHHRGLATLDPRQRKYNPRLDGPRVQRDSVATDRIPFHKLDDFTLAYLEAALWTEDERLEEELPHENGASFDDFSNKFLKDAYDECRKFQVKFDEYIGNNETQAGHDFWLTRNRHGAGFSDRSDLYGDEETEEMIKAAHDAGEVDLYVGEDGLIYA